MRNTLTGFCLLVAIATVAHSDSTQETDLLERLSRARVRVDEAAKLAKTEDLSKAESALPVLDAIREAVGELHTAAAALRAAHGEPTYTIRLRTKPKWIDKTEDRWVRGRQQRTATGSGWVGLGVEVTPSRLLMPALSLGFLIGCRGGPGEGQRVVWEEGSEYVENDETFRATVHIWVPKDRLDLQWIRAASKAKLAPLLTIRHQWVIYKDGSRVGYQ